MLAGEWWNSGHEEWALELLVGGELPAEMVDDTTNNTTGCRDFRCLR